MTTGIPTEPRPTPAQRTGRVRTGLAWAAGLAVLGVTIVIAARRVDASALAQGWQAIRSKPLALAGVFGAYGLAFVVRAAVWRRIVPALTFGHAMAGVHVVLLGNHILPLRLGEPLRVASVVRRAGVPLQTAAASTVMLRLGDVLGLALLGVVLGPAVMLRLVGGWGLGALAAAGLAVAAGMWWFKRSGRSLPMRVPDLTVALGSTAAWVLESVVVWQSAAWVGAPIPLTDAVVVTSVMIGSQVLAVAPGGFGTFDAAGTAALVALGTDAGVALAAVLTAHGLTAAYGILTGAVATVVPTPALGRWRRPAGGTLNPAPDAPSA